MELSLAVGEPAPQFTLADFNGRLVSLKDFSSESNVVLVLNRGLS